jgi:hypothetical protein
MTGAIDYIPVQQRIASLMSHAQASYHKDGSAATLTVNTINNNNNDNNNNNNNSIPAEKIPRSVSSQHQNEASEPASPTSSTASSSSAPSYVRSWGAYSQYRKKSSASSGYQFQGFNASAAPSAAAAPSTAPLPATREAIPRRASRSGSFSHEPAQPLAQPSPFHGLSKYVPVAANPVCFACHKTGM